MNGIGARERRHPTPVAAGRGVPASAVRVPFVRLDRALAVFAVLLVGVSGASAGAGSPAPAGPAVSTEVIPADTGRYYVVGPPRNGQRTYLFEVAAHTLGDGRRYPEIVRLNTGRRQHDGGGLTDPMELRPGWILLLPSDAHGPGVKVGPAPLPDTDARAAARMTGAGHHAGSGAGAYVGGVLALLGMALLLSLWIRRPALLRRNF